MTKILKCYECNCVDLLYTMKAITCIILQRDEVSTHETNQSPPLFIEMPVPSQESGGHVFVLVVSTISTIYLLNLVVVPTVW